MARLLIIAGIGIALLGLLLEFAPAWFGWFGHLPGDIRFKGERFSIFIPITSMLILSVIASLIIHLFSRR